MKLKYLPEFAALLVSHRDEIASGPDRLSDEILGQIYIAFRDRSNRWMGEIDRCVSLEANSAEALLAGRHPVADIAIRVLVNDVFVRCLCAVLVHADKAHGGKRVESLAQNLHLGQMVVRHRVMSRLVSLSNASNDEINLVNNIRERVERWTDMLVGQLGAESQKAFAFEAERSADFESTYSRGTVQGPANHVWRFVLAGLRSGFNRIPDSLMVSQDDRAALAAVLSGISPQITQVTRDELGPRLGTLQL